MRNARGCAMPRAANGLSWGADADELTGCAEVWPAYWAGRSGSIRPAVRCAAGFFLVYRGTSGGTSGFGHHRSFGKGGWIANNPLPVRGWDERGREEKVQCG